MVQSCGDGEKGQTDRKTDRQTSLSQQCQDTGPTPLVSPLDQPPHPGEGKEPVPMSPDSSHIKMPPGHPIQTPNSPRCSHLIGRVPHLLQVFLQHLLGGFTCGEHESEGPGARRRRNPREGTRGERGRARLTLLGLLLGGLAAGVGDARDGLDLAFADGWRVQHQLGRPRQADGQPRRAHQDPRDACAGEKHQAASPQTSGIPPRNLPSKPPRPRPHLPARGSRGWSR